MAATARETTAPVAGPRARFRISPWSRIVVLAGAGLLLGSPDVMAIDVPVLRYQASLVVKIKIDEPGSRVELYLGPKAPALAGQEQALLDAFVGQLEISREFGRFNSLRATPSGGFLRHGFLDAEGRIRLDALRPILIRSRVRSLKVSLAYPQGGINEAAPAGHQVESNGEVIYDTGLAITRDKSLPDLTFHFGYAPTELWRLVPGGSWLVACILVALAARRRYRRRRADDPYGAWYAQWRFLKRLTVVCWLGWLFAVPAAGPDRLFFLIPALQVPGHAWLAIATVWIVPPTAAVALAWGLSSSVLTGLEGAPTSRRSVVVHWVGGSLFLLGFVELIWIVKTSRTHSIPTRDLGVVLAGMLACGFLAGGFRFVVLRADVSPPEELVERARRLARRANVKLRQVIFVAPGWWRLFDYHVSPGGPGRVYLPPAALGRLSRREVDALVAHQVVRMFGGRLRDYLMCLAPVWFGVVAVPVWFALARLIGGSFLAWMPLLIVGVVSLIGGMLSFLTRWFNASGDARAADLTGDPEALITALAKLSRFDLLPQTIGLERDRPLEGPVLWRRLEAIARRAELPPERLREILDGPGSGTIHYELPLVALAADDENRAFSIDWKNQTIRRWRFITVAVTLLTPTLVLAGAQRAGLPAVAAPAVVLLAMVATYFLREVVLTMLRRRAGATLARRAAARLGELPPQGWLVGLAPGPNPRLYNSFSDWDLGYLTLDGDRLVYRGEQATFSLGRDQIAWIEMGPGLPLPRPRIYVQWHADPQGRSGTLSLDSYEHGWAGRPRVTTGQLHRRLGEWWKGQPLASTTPTPDALHLPDLQATGAVPRLRGFVVATSIFVWTLLAFPLPLLGGLTFDWDKGGWGWWLLIAVPSLILVIQVPYLCYRDRNSEAADPLKADREDRPRRRPRPARPAPAPPPAPGSASSEGRPDSRLPQ